MGKKTLLLHMLFISWPVAEKRGIFPIRSDSWKIIVDTAIVAGHMHVIQA